MNVEWLVYSNGHEAWIVSARGHLIAHAVPTNENERREFDARVVSPLRFFVACANEGLQARNLKDPQL